MGEADEELFAYDDEYEYEESSLEAPSIGLRVGSGVPQSDRFAHVADIEVVDERVRGSFDDDSSARDDAFVATGDPHHNMPHLDFTSEEGYDGGEESGTFEHVQDAMVAEGEASLRPASQRQKRPPPPALRETVDAKSARRLGAGLVVLGTTGGAAMVIGAMIGLTVLVFGFLKFVRPLTGGVVLPPEPIEVAPAEGEPSLEEEGTEVEEEVAPEEVEEEEPEEEELVEDQSPEEEVAAPKPVTRRRRPLAPEPEPEPAPEPEVVVAPPPPKPAPVAPPPPEEPKKRGLFRKKKKK